MIHSAAAFALVSALLLAPARAAGENPPPAERLIRSEPSIAERVLAAPYTIVALTAWPLKQLLFFMEDVNLPARVGDVITFPVRVFREDDE